MVFCIRSFNCKDFKQKHLLSVLFGLAYAVSSASETIAVKSLNYNSPPINLPGYTSLLTNQVWLLMIPVYIYQRKLSSAPLFTWDHIVNYSGMGVLTFIVTILRNISVNAIPGSVFALLISTSILFNMILSYLFLKKKFNQWHIGAALCCIASALSISISIFTTEELHAMNVNFETGISSAISASFFIACMTVWQEQLQSKWDDINLRITEMTCVASLLASLLTIVYSVFSREIMHWKPDILLATADKNGYILVISVSIALPIIKLVVRNSKYSTIQFSNAFFFEFVQASGALVGSVANILLFNESWGVGYILSFVLLKMSFDIYIKARLVSKKISQIENSTQVGKTTHIQINNPIEPKIVLKSIVPWK